MRGEIVGVVGFRGSYAQEDSASGLRVSETEPLSRQKSAKSRGKNPNSLRSDMRIFGPNADSCLLRGSRSPANANRRRSLPELAAAMHKV